MLQMITLLIKPVSSACNYRCQYCFYHDVTRHRVQSNRGMMSQETLDILLKRAFETGARQVNLAWQGGEPTMAGLDFFSCMTRRIRELKPAGVHVTQTIQTNGSLLNDDWCRFFVKEGFLVGISLDGPKEYHDALRLDSQGMGTFRQAMNAIRLMSRHKVAFNVLTVVNGYNSRHAGKLYQFFIRNALRYLQFIPCLDSFDESNSEPFSLTSTQYGRFLIELYRMWEADFRAGNEVSIRHIDNAIRTLAGFPSEECGTLGRCSLYTVVEADGQVYPCDFYCMDQYALGNLAEHSIEELCRSGAAQAFLNPSLTLPEQCSVCPYGFLCRGGCRRHRDHSGTLGENRFCHGLQSYYEACLPSMAAIAHMLK